MPWVKNLYEIEPHDKEGPVATYAAFLTDGQAAALREVLDLAVAGGILKFYRFVPYPPRQAHLQALGYGSVLTMVRDDIAVAARRRSGKGPSVGRRSPQLGAEELIELGAIAVQDLHGVLLEVRDRHPGIRLREWGVRGPRGIWDIDALVEAVARDLGTMTARERAGYDVHRYSWGYDAEGRVQVVHWPVRGGAVTQFLQE